MVTAQEICESWINGNQSQIRKLLKRKSKVFCIDLIAVMVGQYGYKYHLAIAEIRKMCEV